jgi:hypothetical protein
MAKKKNQPTNEKLTGAILSFDKDGNITRTENNKTQVVSRQGTTVKTITNPSPNQINNQTTTKPTVNMKQFQTEAHKNYDEKLNVFNKASQDYINKRNEEANKRGVINQKFAKIDYKDKLNNGIVTDKATPLEKERQYEAVEPLINAATEKERQEKSNARNELNFARYLSDYADVENDDVNWFDKTIGYLPSQLKGGVEDYFSNITQDNKFVDENGNVIYLPSKADMQKQKVDESLGKGIGADIWRFLGNAAHEGGKQLSSAGTDALTFGLGGKAIYYSDIALDQYKQNINNGYSEQDAASNAVTKGIATYVKQKLLGGLGGKLTGKGPSWLEKILTNKLGSYISDPRMLSAASSAGSETVDEFTDEYVERVIDLATLDKSKNVEDYLNILLDKDTFFDALYSGGIGGITGGVTGGVNVSEDAINTVAGNKLLDRYQKQPQAQRYENPMNNYQFTNITPQQAVNDVRNNEISNQVNAFNLNNNANNNTQMQQLSFDMNGNINQENRNIAETMQQPVIRENLEQEKQQAVNTLVTNLNNNNANQSSQSINEIRNIIESQVSPDRRLSQFIETESKANNTIKDILNMDPNSITYKTQSHEESDRIADSRLNGRPINEQYGIAKGILDSDKKMRAEDTATILKVMDNLLQSGDMVRYRELKADLGVQLSQAGQFIEYVSMLKTMDPLEQLDMLEKLVIKEQNKGNKIYTGIKFNQDLVNDVINSYDSNGNWNQQHFEEAMELLKDDIANQMPTTLGEKANAFRYLAMLGNFRTHGRNVLANKFMGLTQRAKNKIAAALETGVDKVSQATTGKGIQRTKTLEFTRPEIKSLVLNDANETYNVDNFKNKYNETSSGIKADLESRRKTFGKSKAGELLNKGYEFNNKMLSKEDIDSAKKMYISSMGNYLTANKIYTKADFDAHPDVVANARNYAKGQANEATFHQYSKTGETIRKTRENLRHGSIYSQIAGFGLDSALPFVNTPINIMKTGIEYTPGVGMLRTVNDFVKASKADKASVVIDSLSKQFTGLALAGIGMYLKKNGYITGAKDDDKEAKLEGDLGKADYSLHIGNQSFDLSWLSPAAMPLFTGVEFQKMLEENKINADPTNMINAVFSTVNPVADMSVLQSITSMLQSFGSKDKEYPQILAEKAFTNYVSQYIPTLFSQLAATFDDKQRDAFTGDNVAEKTIKQVMYKIPGARNLLPEKVDSWGETKTNTPSALKSPVSKFALRAFESFISPMTRKEIKIDDTTRELERLAKETKTSVLPTARDKKIKIGDEEYNLKGKDYNLVQSTYGKTAKKNLDLLVKSDEYKNASDLDKKYMVGQIYDYAIYKSKEKYAEEKALNFSDKSYNQFALVDAFNIPYTDYTRLMLNKVEGEKDDNGKTISGSKKNNVIKTLNDSNIDETSKQAILNYMDYSYYIDEDKVNKAIDNSNIPDTQKPLLKEAIRKNISENEKARYKRAKDIGIDYALFEEFRTFVENTKADKDRNGKTISGSKKQKVINWIQSQKLTAEQKQKLYNDYINNQGIFSYYK